MYWGVEKYVQGFGEHTSRKGHLEDLGVDGKIMLEQF
jgi:hypothetical protein